MKSTLQRNASGTWRRRFRRCRKQLAMLPGLRSLPAMLLSLLAFRGMHAKHVDASTGEPVGKADDWLHHLRNTLFVDDTRILDKLEDRIKGSWPYIHVLACKTRANRFFYVCCKKCRQFSYGDYGTWAIGKDPEAPERARHDLAKFFKLEVTSDGGRIV